MADALGAVQSLQTLIDTVRSLDLGDETNLVNEAQDALNLLAGLTGPFIEDESYSDISDEGRPPVTNPFIPVIPLDADGNPKPFHFK